MPRSAMSIARKHFDNRFGATRRAADVLRAATPRIGWIRSVRTLLEMSNRALAQRLAVSHPTLLKLEKSEQAGTISLASLRKAAEALDADLVYALVPRRKLGEVIGARAHAVAAEQIAAIAKTMALEAQAISGKEVERQIQELAEELEKKPRDLWR